MKTRVTAGLALLASVVFLTAAPPAQAGSREAEVTASNQIQGSGHGEDQAQGVSVAKRVAVLEATVNMLARKVRDLQAQLQSVQTSGVMALSPYLTVTTSPNPGPRVVFSGIDVQIVNGTGRTDSANGLGNLIIGYDADNLSGPAVCSIGTFSSQSECEGNGGIWAPNQKTGSHYLVVGDENNYTQYGGIVVGLGNTSNGPYATVSGGRDNRAGGEWTSVSGGASNTASGRSTSVSGGVGNSAVMEWDSVSGGANNVAGGWANSVSGGRNNSAGGHYSSVSGGAGNGAIGDLGGASVSGGTNNQAREGASVSGGTGNTAALGASVSGGTNNDASSTGASISGGMNNVASGANASISGGVNNSASVNATVSGGYNRSATGEYDWVAGSLFEDY